MSKTLEEIKEQYAKEQKQDSFDDMFISHKKSKYYGFLYNKAVSEIAERYAETQNQALTAWKESMMKVHSELDLQGIGAALGLPLGSSIAPQVLPKVKELIEQNRELIEMLEEIQIELLNLENTAIPDTQLCIKITELLTKYNHLKSNTNETDKI